jgi:gluconolactonase
MTDKPTLSRSRRPHTRSALQRACVSASASVECLYQGARWSEGPVWFGDGRYLLWSDIPNNRILRWDEETATVTPFRQPSNNANGNTRDREGRLVTLRASDAPRHAYRVRRFDHRAGRSLQRQALNSPNDVIVKSDGSIWFTDPDLRHRRLLRRRAAGPGVAGLRVSRRRAERRSDDRADDVIGPNGLASRRMNHSVRRRIACVAAQDPRLRRQRRPRLTNGAC